MFGDLRVSRFLQSGEEEGQCGWCVVSSFASLSLSLSLSQLEFWFPDRRLPSFDLCPLSRNWSFISFFSSDRIRFGFLWVFSAKVTDWPKNYFWLFLFFDSFRHFAMRWSYAQKPFFFILKKVSAPITSGECFHGRQLQSLFCVYNKLERDHFQSYKILENLLVRKVTWFMLPTTSASLIFVPRKINAVFVADHMTKINYIYLLRSR